MCEIITISYHDQTLDELKTAEYDPEAAGHTCTCELKDVPSSPASAEALAAFGRWVMQTYQMIRNTTGEYAVPALLEMR